jgi:hypothetical protein
MKLKKIFMEKPGELPIIKPVSCVSLPGPDEILKWSDAVTPGAGAAGTS